MLAKWNGAMNSDTARMLTAAGVAVFFVAILTRRGPYSNVKDQRDLWSDFKWEPSAQSIQEEIQRLAPGEPADLDTCRLMCAFLESEWPEIFQSSDSVSKPAELANAILQRQHVATAAPVPWSRTPKPADLFAVTDLGADGTPPLFVDVKYTPDGLPPSNVPLCLELLATGRRLLEATAGASVNVSASFRYAALEPFYRSGLEPVNVGEAWWMIDTELEARSAAATTTSTSTTTTAATATHPRASVDLGDPRAFFAPGSANFLFDVDHERSLMRGRDDFRTTPQRVRQQEFVRHYMRLVAQRTLLSGDDGDDVTVMMNMAARLDRMWRRDFVKHGIAGMPTKIELRSKWQAKFGGDALRATKDTAAVMELGGGGGLALAARALSTVRGASATSDAPYMDIKYQWPSESTMASSQELRQLRHELGVFSYNRRALPFAMERLALDIIVVEACCVNVLNKLDAIESTPDAQQAWAIVCFAMFTVFDLRPVFMSTTTTAAAATGGSSPPVLVQQLDARRNNHKLVL